ncbi:MAG: carboxylating nicotinate-nucleotide diphosphorylase [Pseudomonadota bacterium]
MRVSRFNAHITPERLAKDRNKAVHRALKEDVGKGDVTAALVSATELARATVVVREDAVLCGRDWFDAVFAELDSDVTIDWAAADGDALEADQVVCRLSGPARALLTGERTALNFLQTLSGTATVARRYSDALADTGCRVLDTRKTIPGLRLAQKYAARTGGAVNHRIGLFDAILIKENHIASAGSIADAVRAARASSPALPVEIEVESLAELERALDAGVERVLLDNFSLSDLEQAVAINRAADESAELEASGGVEFDDLAGIAATGVDYISTGALTKHLRATDFSMRFAFERKGS